MIKNVFGALLLLGITVLAYSQYLIVDNQKAAMRQQFHSDFIAIISLLDESGLKKLHTSTDSEDLTLRENYATGLLIQRFIIAHRIKNAFSAGEWQALERDMRAAIGIPILRARWEQVKKWYPENERKFIDGLLPERPDPTKG